MEAKIKIRFWYWGIAPRTALELGSTYQYEVQVNGSWRPGKYHLGGLAAWMEENNWSIESITRVDQKNGRAGYRALYEFTLKDNYVEPEEPLWVKEELPNPMSTYLKGALNEVDYTSVPGTNGKGGMEIKAHRPPDSFRPDWEVV